MTDAFPMVEKAVKELIEEKLTGASGKVGGDLSYDGTLDFYVWIGLIPGGGTDQIDGTWNIDIDIFAPKYATAMTKSLALEALLVSPRHRTDTMLLDNCYQNGVPAERPWDDESVFRIGTTYTFTARRSG
jgi:hypothetical protein